MTSAVIHLAVQSPAQSTSFCTPRAFRSRSFRQDVSHDCLIQRRCIGSWTKFLSPKTSRTELHKPYFTRRWTSRLRALGSYIEPGHHSGNRRRR